MAEKHRGKAAWAVDCGICGAYHPEGFDGDCRDDENRLPYPRYCTRCKSEWTGPEEGECPVCKESGNPVMQGRP